jgi:acetyl-CoA C-acetyltransferase
MQPNDVDAYWLGTMGQLSGLTLSIPLKIDYKPVTTSRTSARRLRGAPTGLLCGRVGRVRHRDGDRRREAQGLRLLGPRRVEPAQRRHARQHDGAGLVLAARARLLQEVRPRADKGKEVLARIAWKNHRNGAKNPKAQFRKEVPMETILNSPKVADPLGVMDCSGVADGSAAAIVVRAEDAHKYTKHPIYIKALSFVAGPGEGPLAQDYDFTTFREVVASAKDAYKQAGVTDPRKRSAWPRSTTASRRPSSCSTRTSASARAARPGRTS